jgi:hypothetical protein
MDYKQLRMEKDLESRLLSQKSARVNCEGEILRLQELIERQEETMASLDLEIKKTKDMITNSKGGEK